MTPNAPRNVVAIAHVASVPRSIDFYQKLGFSVANTFPEDAPKWASLESGGANLMIAEADQPLSPEQQAVMFYLYVDDVPGKRDELVKSGIECGEIWKPFFSPRGEFRIKDPDGYVFMVAHT